MPETGGIEESREDAGEAREYTFRVRVNPEMLRDVSLFFMWRRFKWRYIGGWMVAGLSAAIYRVAEPGPFTTGLGVLTAGLAIVLIALPITVWFAVRRTVEGYATLTAGMPVEYEIDDDWLISRYATESGELPWSAFKEVVRTRNVLLLVMESQERFIPLPVEQVPDEALQFIEDRIAESG